MSRRAVPAAITLALADAVPSVAAIAAVRRHVLPRLAGTGSPDHVALTVDDGPHPESTPRFVDTLGEAGLHATFFFLGEAAHRWPGEARRVADAGHEIALHGYGHRAHLLRTPAGVAADVVRGRRAIEDVTGRTARWWRPPHGIATATGLTTAAALGLRPVLWTADGADWVAGATLSQITGRLYAHTRGGGVVLLHDAPGERGAQAVAAAAAVAAWCAERGWRVGPLADHGLERRLPCG